jgi:hypothetical protein
VQWLFCSSLALFLLSTPCSRYATASGGRERASEWSEPARQIAYAQELQGLTEIRSAPRKTHCRRASRSPPCDFVCAKNVFALDELFISATRCTGSHEVAGQRGEDF